MFGLFPLEFSHPPPQSLDFVSAQEVSRRFEDDPTAHQNRCHEEKNENRQVIADKS